MGFKSKRGFGFYCKSSYILLVISVCAVKFNSEKASATVANRTGSLVRSVTNSFRSTFSGGQGSGQGVNQSMLRSGGSLGAGNVNSISGSGLDVRGSIGGANTPDLSSLRSGSSVSGVREPVLRMNPATGQFNGGNLGGVEAQSFQLLRVSHKYGVSAKDFNINFAGGNIDPDKKYVQFPNSGGDIITLEKSALNRINLFITEDRIGIDNGIDKKCKIYLQNFSIVD